MKFGILMAGLVMAIAAISKGSLAQELKTETAVLSYPPLVTFIPTAVNPNR